MSGANRKPKIEKEGMYPDRSHRSRIPRLFISRPVSMDELRGCCLRRSTSFGCDTMTTSSRSNTREVSEIADLSGDTAIAVSDSLSLPDSFIGSPAADTCSVAIGKDINAFIRIFFITLFAFLFFRRALSITRIVVFQCL